MTITDNLLRAFQLDTATAAIERVEFTAEDKVVEESAGGWRSRGVHVRRQPTYRQAITWRNPA